jgi:hypothetical protein
VLLDKIYGQYGKNNVIIIPKNAKAILLILGFKYFLIFVSGYNKIACNNIDKLIKIK